MRQRTHTALFIVSVFLTFFVVGLSLQGNPIFGDSLFLWAGATMGGVLLAGTFIARVIPVPCVAQGCAGAMRLGLRLMSGQFFYTCGMCGHREDSGVRLGKDRHTP